MIRAGGLFILIMGIGASGWAVAAPTDGDADCGRCGRDLGNHSHGKCADRPLGTPTRLQFWALAAAIALEIVLIRVVVARYKRAGERPFLNRGIICRRSAFSADGDHLRSAMRAAGTLRHGECRDCLLVSARVFSLNRAWIMDGVLKLAFGGLTFAMASEGPIA